MATIYKYVLEPRDAQQVNMPNEAVVLSADVQRGEICIWAKVPTDRPAAAMARKIADVEAIRARTFLIYGTGHPMPDHDNFKFIGTVMLQSGDLVLHIFEVPNA